MSTPRRNDINRMSATELAIYHAQISLEGLGADVRLTEAGDLLGQARAKVADFVDEGPNAKKAP